MCVGSHISWTRPRLGVPSVPSSLPLTRSLPVLGWVQDKGQLLENVFADPRGFGIGPDGRYRYEQPGFTSGTAEVS